MHDAVKFIAGQSYRSPSLFEIYTASPNISGNPDLKPETSDSIELVYQHAQGGLYTQIGGYWAKVPTTRSSGRKGRRRPMRRTLTRRCSTSTARLSTAQRRRSRNQVHDRTLGQLLRQCGFMSGTSGDLVVEQPGSYMNYNFRYVPKYTAKAGAARQWGPFGASASLDHSAVQPMERSVRSIRGPMCS